MLRAAGRAEDSLRYYERTLKISSELWGEKHPGTIQALNNYAGALDALPHYERAGSLAQSAHGCLRHLW